MDTFVCEHCRKDVSENAYDMELGMCNKCIEKLRIDFKKAKDDEPSKKYKIDLHD